MKNLKFITRIFLITLSAFCISAFAQDDEQASRSITSLDFKAKRQPAAGGASVKPFSKPTTPKRRNAVATITNPKRRYNLVKRIHAKKSSNRFRQTRIWRNPYSELKNSA